MLIPVPPSCPCHPAPARLQTASTQSCTVGCAACSLSGWMWTVHSTFTGGVLTWRSMTEHCVAWRSAADARLHLPTLPLAPHILTSSRADALCGILSSSAAPRRCFHLTFRPSLPLPAAPWWGAWRRGWHTLRCAAILSSAAIYARACCPALPCPSLQLPGGVHGGGVCADRGRERRPLVHPAGECEVVGLGEVMAGLCASCW